MLCMLCLNTFYDIELQSSKDRAIHVHQATCRFFCMLKLQKAPKHATHVEHRLQETQLPMAQKASPTCATCCCWPCSQPTMQLQNVICCNRVGDHAQAGCNPSGCFQTAADIGQISISNLSPPVITSSHKDTWRNFFLGCYSLHHALDFALIARVKDKLI